MKYFMIFNHTSAYTEYMATEDATVPNIAYCYEDGQTYITPSQSQTRYRWVNLDPTVYYYCNGTTKYYKQQKQVSEDGGQTWENVVPAEYQQGGVAQEQSTDCGYIPPQYRWINIDPSIDYYCDSETYTKYYKQQYQVSYDGGTTWENVVPAQYQQGGVAEQHSVDCGYIPPVYTTFVIEGASTVSAETCQYVAIGDNSDNVTTSSTWSITAGSQYATINSSTGEVTILNGANESSVTIQAVYSNLTATTTVTLTYLSGATSETTSETTTDASGNTTTVVTTVTEYEDGSSSEVIESVITDESGNTIGSSQSTTETAADGSYEGTTTNYDANGNPTDGTNVTGDTDHNVSTQNVEYDASGNTVVTGYEIDTSGSSDGEKTFNNDGVNTEYYAFDVTRGFILDFNFTINFNQQPSGQDENHHNILCSKRASPDPWYGFQIRQTGTNKYVQLGTQFSGTSSVNTQITSASTGVANESEYDVTITYNPTASTTFICRDNIHNTNVYTSNKKFPDIDDLKYLKVTIGYALNASGNPFRYSNIKVKNFNLRRI